MNQEITMPVIGIMHSAFREKFGIPRQSNLIDSISYVLMHAPYDDMHGFEGLAQFSHIWLLWHFHDNKRTNSAKDYQTMIRPPRLGGNQKIGVFASRSMYRPAAIGLSVVEFVAVRREQGETRVYIRGADLLHGTPVLDIKPYITYVDAVVEAKSGYAQEKPSIYPVVWTEEAQLQAHVLKQAQRLSFDILDEIEQIIALNPKPAYQHDNDKIYGLRYANFNVQFRTSHEKMTIVAITLISDG